MNENTINPRENIKHNLRKIRGFRSTRIFGEEMEIPEKTLQAMEQGRAANIENLVIISEKTGITLDEICKTKIQD